MAEENTVPVTAATEGAAAVKAPKAKKRNAPKRQKSAAGTARFTKAPAEKALGGKNRKYSAEEKLEKLKWIETQVAGGASTLKDAVKSVGISEQTYYNWKNSLPLVGTTAVETVSASDEFAEFVRLETENQRLRKLLSEKLRAENSDLRKRLGLD
ncbi:hypothetical protein D9M68_227150 [compost metagenome]